MFPIITRQARTDPGVIGLFAYTTAERAQVALSICIIWRGGGADSGQHVRCTLLFGEGL